MKIIGAIIPKLEAMFQAHKTLHGMPPSCILVSQDIRDRLTMEVNDMREFFGGKRLNHIERFRKVPIATQAGENHISMG